MPIRVGAQQVVMIGGDGDGGVMWRTIHCGAGG